MLNSKIIVALDYSDKSAAWRLIDQLDPKLCALKVGNEMFTLFGPDFVHSLVEKHYQVFLDLKFHDIPNTVAKACRSAAALGVWMINLHASGGLTMMSAAREALEQCAHRPLIIAVTVLTSMAPSELASIGVGTSLENQVTHLAKLSHQAGMDGVVCSAYEVPAIKSNLGKDFLTVTPGIRLQGDEVNDQLRVMTPVKAVAYGSDFLVIGRPITQAAQPGEVIKSILSVLR